MTVEEFKTIDYNEHPKHFEDTLPLLTKELGVYIDARQAKGDFDTNQSEIGILEEFKNHVLITGMQAVEDALHDVNFYQYHEERNKENKAWFYEYLRSKIDGSFSRKGGIEQVEYSENDFTVDENQYLDNQEFSERIEETEDTGNNEDMDLKTQVFYDFLAALYKEGLFTPETTFQKKDNFVLIFKEGVIQILLADEEEEKGTQE